MNGLRDLIVAAGRTINILLSLAAGAAVLVFLWGLVLFLFKADDEKAKEEGRNRMLWGVIALFVMVSVWGIVYFIQSALGLDVLHWGWDTIPDNGTISV